MHPSRALLLRRDAAQATFDRFDGAAFRWSSNDCARMAAFNLRKLGYESPMPKSGSYSSALGAMKALRAAGFESLGAALDSLGLERIAPISALPGDIIGLPGEGGWTALTVALGNGRVLGFMDREGRGVAGALQPRDYVCAWRVNPCLK
jgi:hypothetical protein